MKRSILMNTLLAGLVALTAALPASAASSVEKAISAAESAISQAKENDWIWRDTEKFLDQAKAAAEKGDEATAMKFAERAREQAELAIKQYQIEEEMDRGL